MAKSQSQNPSPQNALAETAILGSSATGARCDGNETGCQVVPHFADAARCITAPIIYHERIAVDTYQIGFEAVSMAEQAVPGQFFMFRLAGRNDPLIGRALAMYDRKFVEGGSTGRIDVVYLVKGKFTQALSQCGVGTLLDVWGPLGNGFSTSHVDHLILVCGGVGQTPMLTLGREALGRDVFGGGKRPNGYAKRVTLCYGARSADRLAGIPDFQSAGLELQLSTDDGTQYSGISTKGGLVTTSLESVLNEEPDEARRIACCGPEPMMEAVAKLAARYGVPCEVSLETPMACGIGICFTCVAKIGESQGNWDYKRTCVEGPIFDAKTIIW